MENIYQNIKNKVKMGALGLAGLALVNGCAPQEAPERTDYNNLNSYTNLIGHPRKVVMLDENRDGRIDGLRDDITYLAIDTSKTKGNYPKYTVIMDENMINLANQISNAQKELAFKIDSARYVQRKGGAE